ncbi:MAG: PEPxxWA-CTERM sorting domain-containing protein [Pseudomonadota bacterium]
MRNTNLWASFGASLAAAGVIAVGAPVQARVVTVADTGDPTQTNFGYTLLNTQAIPGFGSQSIAARFTVDQELTITSVKGWVGRFAQGPSTYHITLYADGPGPNHWVPGAMLYSVGLSDGGPGSGYIGSDSLNWAVTAGAYWVGFEVLETDTLFGYMPYFVPRPLREALGPPGAYNPAPGAPGSAFRILASVPEPGTWGLMILGFGTAGVALRTRRRVAAV